MNIIPFVIVSIFAIQMLRKLLETEERLPVWDKFLSKIWIIAVAFLGISFYPPLKFILDWYHEFIYVIAFNTAYLLRNYRPSLFDPSKKVSTDRVYLLRNYRPARQVLLSLFPLGIVYILNAIVKLINSDFHQEHISTSNFAYAVTTFWLIGFGIYAITQIHKEKKLSLKIQEENQIAEARKAELEKLVTERTNQLTIQNEKLEKALKKLKSTQALLIQSEKMASLGELTAGIAHEIQNPLNFVNNFSEVSAELVDEIEEERTKNLEARNETLVSEILRDIKQNLEKINHHGKRADAIVKGMLEHSRTSSGEKVLTDINALADEYLRLSYHGMRAKDKSFNADFKTDFDPNLPKVNVVPQDIGRVLLNIINNAFQACSSKFDIHHSSFEIQKKPIVIVTTKNLENFIEISIQDNGPGIPSSIKGKIFQPFFTTKPTGQGTGLGLSLSYDIVKAHGGEIEVQSHEVEGTTFNIILPFV